MDTDVAVALIMLEMSKQYRKIEIKKVMKCRKCVNCIRYDCGKCINCKDKYCFGGNNIRKKSCIKRKCLNPINKVKMVKY